GSCFTSLPLPSTIGTSPRAPTARTASRAPIPFSSGTFTELGSGGPTGGGGPRTVAAAATLTAGAALATRPRFGTPASAGSAGSVAWFTFLIFGAEFDGGTPR